MLLDSTNAALRDVAGLAAWVAAILFPAGDATDEVEAMYLFYEYDGSAAGADSLDVTVETSDDLVVWVTRIPGADAVEIDESAGSGLEAVRVTISFSGNVFARLRATEK